jgi:hypothetical protein
VHAASQLSLAFMARRVGKFSLDFAYRPDQISFDVSESGSVSILTKHHLSV